MATELVKAPEYTVIEDTEVVVLTKEQVKIQAIGLLGLYELELSTLGSKSQEIDMTAGDMFNEIKEKGLYKASGIKFKDFCVAAGWSHSTANLLMRISENEELRANYGILGMMKCKQLLDSKFKDAELSEFLQIALDSTNAELKEAIADRKEENNPTVENPNELLIAETALLEELKVKIADCQSNIEMYTKQIADSAK